MSPSYFLSSRWPSLQYICVCTAISSIHYLIQRLTRNDLSLQLPVHVQVLAYWSWWETNFLRAGWVDVTEAGKNGWLHGCIYPWWVHASEQWYWKLNDSESKSVLTQTCSHICGICTVLNFAFQFLYVTAELVEIVFNLNENLLAQTKYACIQFPDFAVQKKVSYAWPPSQILPKTLELFQVGPANEDKCMGRSWAHLLARGEEEGWEGSTRNQYFWCIIPPGRVSAENQSCSSKYVLH